MTNNKILLDSILKSLTTSFNEIERLENSFKTRSDYNSRHYAFDIKVYDFLNEEDINFIIEKLGITSEAAKQQIYKEFNENSRLNSIRSHVCDYELESFLNFTGDELCFNSKDFTVQGRNGGWLVYLPLDSDYLDKNTNLSFETLRKLASYDTPDLSFWRTAFCETNRDNCRDVIAILESDLEEVNRIAEILRKLERVQDYIAVIKEDFIESLLSQLEWEIEGFVNNELDSVVIKANKIAKIEDDIITTDLGAKCTLKEAKEA